MGANEANLGANLNEANPRTGEANLNPSAQNPNAGANLGAKNPRASQRELEGSIDFSQLEKSDFTPNFTQVSQSAPYQYAKQKFIPEQWINEMAGILTPNWQTNLKTLALKHPEMFKSESDVFRLIREIKSNPNRFFANNNEHNALIGKDLENGKFGEIGVRKNDGEIIHATKNNIKRLDRLKTRNSEILGNTSLDVSDRARRLPSHSDTSQTMPTTSSVGSTAGEILPQNADNFAQNLDQSAQNLSNANLNAPNLSGDLPNANLNAPNLSNANANFHNPRAEFSANNAYENFSNPNNPRFMSGGGGENPRFISASQNPRANVRELEERTGFLNGEHLGAKEVALMNGSVDFTHLKKADLTPNSSANLAFENSEDVLTWRAPKANGANVGENLKPNRANTARSNEAQNGANSGASEGNSRVGNLDTNSANSHVANEGADGAHSEANLGKRGETSTHENLDENSANQGADEANLRARQEAHAKAQQEAINEQEHLSANSLTNDTRADEANLSATNASSADTTKTPKAKLTKEQNEAQKLLKQILKALKTSPTKKPFSISTGEKQTYKDAINEKLKELKEKEQILSTNKEQPSANSYANEINLDANPHANSANSYANEANLHSTHGANSNEANLSSADTTKAPKVKLTKEQIEAQMAQI